MEVQRTTVVENENRIEFCLQCSQCIWQAGRAVGGENREGAHCRHAETSKNCKHVMPNHTLSVIVDSDGLNNLASSSCLSRKQSRQSIT